MNNYYILMNPENIFGKFFLSNFYFFKFSIHLIDKNFSDALYYSEVRSKPNHSKNNMIWMKKRFLYMYN